MTRQAPLDLAFAALALAAALVVAWTWPRPRPAARPPCAVCLGAACDPGECLGCTCGRDEVRAALDRTPRRLVAERVARLRTPGPR